MCLLSACTKPYVADAVGKLTMQPSVTYLYLLRDSAFFKSLNTSQLRWVIKHSKEWKIIQGGVIATSQSKSDYWLLLDGSWQLTCQQQSHLVKQNYTKAWFNSSTSQLGCELRATSSSFVMRIRQNDMQTMIEHGFPFDIPEKETRYSYTDLTPKTHHSVVQRNKTH
jgi:hypothetical protein